MSAPTAILTANIDVMTQLAELEDIAARASSAVDQVAIARAASERAVALCRATRAEYFEAVGAGDREADSEVETALHQAVTDALRTAEADVWEASEAGARRLAQRRDATVTEFFATNFERIAATWAIEDGHARLALQRAHDERQRAEEVYARSLRRWRTAAERHGQIDPSELPSLPTRGEPGVVAERFAQGIEAPTPRSVLPITTRPALVA